MDLLPVVLLTVLALVGAGVGVALAVSGAGLRSRGDGQRDTGLLRVTAEVHTGWEQTLLGLYRELGLPRQPDGLAYGALYVEPQNEQRLLLRSRSEIGRGFLGAADIQPGRRSTTVRYTILRLPGDDRVRDRVLDLELQIITALRRIDRDVEVQLSGGALRELERESESAATGEGDAGGR